MRSRIIILVLAVLSSLSLSVAQAADLTAAAKTPQPRRILKFDVSELATRFVFDETPLDANGKPAYGNEFITEGVIYEHGTLNGTDGVIVVEENGKKVAKPEFPDKVIGRWTCRGWHVGEGAATVTGPWVATNQIYDFAATPGQAMFTTDGLELVDIGVAIERAITGGTGPYRHMRGTATQTMVGFNASEGVNLRFEVKP